MCDVKSKLNYDYYNEGKVVKVEVGFIYRKSVKVELDLFTKKIKATRGAFFSIFRSRNFYIPSTSKVFF